MKVSIIMPTRGRVQQAARCIERLRETTRGHDVECIAVTEDPPKTLREAGAYVLSVYDGTAVQKWNWGACAANGDALFLGADDLWWGDGWLDEALAVMQRAQVVAINDGHINGNGLGTHYMATRKWLCEAYGGVLVVPHYRSWFVDVEMTMRAQAAGVYAWAEQACVEHRHVLWRKAADDETYQRGKAFQRYDELIFNARHKAGFPNDYEDCIEENA